MQKVEGQVNLRDAARRSISYISPETGKHYGLAEGAKLAVLLVRPRGWHLDEAHVTVDGRCVVCVSWCAVCSGNVVPWNKHPSTPEPVRYEGGPAGRSSAPRSDICVGVAHGLFAS